MAFVPVQKDLNRIKKKVMFNLTKRQLICFAMAAAVGKYGWGRVLDYIGVKWEDEIIF